MKFPFLSMAFLLLLTTVLSLAMPAMAAETDYLSLMAEGSEIKAIAVVTNVRPMSNNADGTFKHVTFKRIYALTPFIPESFVGGCKTLESGWQKRAPGMIYFKPRKGQKVYVTITTNGGAITSYTLLNHQLEMAIKEAPNRITYAKGLAKVTPLDN